MVYTDNDYASSQGRHLGGREDLRCKWDEGEPFVIWSVLYFANTWGVYINAHCSKTFSREFLLNKFKVFPCLFSSIWFLVNAPL